LEKRLFIYWIGVQDELKLTRGIGPIE